MFFQWSFVGLPVQTGDWAGAKQVSVLFQPCGCCLVVVDWYLMLCQAQYICNLVWNGQWSGTASGEYLCLLPASSMQTLGWDWGHSVFSVVMCFLKERCESRPSPRNFVDCSTGRGVLPSLTEWDYWTLGCDVVECTTLHSRAANLKSLVVAHSCMAFTACCKCLSMVSREPPRKQIARSSTKSALKMSLAIWDGNSLILSPKHVTANTPHTFFWVEFVWECGADSDSNLAIPKILCYKSRQSASEAYPVQVSDDTVLPGGFIICLLRVKEETNRLLSPCKSIPDISLEAHWVVHGAAMLPKATLASVKYTRFFKIQDQLGVDHVLSDLAQTAGQRDWSVTEWVSVVLVWFRDGDHSCRSPLMREVSCGPDVIQDIFEVTEARQEPSHSKNCLQF